MASLTLIRSACLLIFVALLRSVCDYIFDYTQAPPSTYLGSEGLTLTGERAHLLTPLKDLTYVVPDLISDVLQLHLNLSDLLIFDKVFTVSSKHKRAVIIICRFTEEGGGD